MLRFGYAKRKKLYKEYAKDNLNLAFGENEFGEVIPEIRKEIIEELTDRNKLTYSAEKLMPYTFAKIFFMPGAFLIIGYLIDKSLGAGVCAGLAFFSFFVGLFMYLFVRRIAGSSTKVELAKIVNSKVVLDDNCLEYSYSTLDPKSTEGQKDTNYVVCRMKYCDINEIQYDKRKNSYKLSGTYHVRRYKNYNIKDEDPQSIDEDIRGETLEIYDVFSNRDLFAIISGKVHKKVGLCELDRKEKGIVATCTVGFTFLAFCDTVLYGIMLMSIIFGVFNL